MMDRGTRRLRDLVRGQSARASYWAQIDQGIVSGISFLTTILIGRVASESELGLYSLAFTVMLFVANSHDSLVTTPYTIFGNRMDPSERRTFAGSALAHAGSLALIASLATLTLAGLLAAAGGPPGSPSLMLVLALVAPMLLAREFARRFSFAHLRMRTALAVDAVVSGLFVLGMGGLVATGRLSARAAYVALGIACLLTAGIWFGHVRREIEVRRERLVRDWRKNWIFSRWIFAGQMVSVMRGYSIHWFLALTLGTAATGIYSACLTVVAISNPFILGILNILTPRMARAVADGGRDELWRVSRKIALLVALAMSVFCLVLVIWGGRLVGGIYGEAFAGNGDVVAVIALATWVASLDLAPIVGLRVLERPDLSFGISLVGVVVMLGVATAVVYQGGLLGVSFGLLAGNLVVTVIAWTAFCRVLSRYSGSELSES
jgi:O-antigen/teichoic acid export membrane protein